MAENLWTIHSARQQIQAGSLTVADLVGVHLERSRTLQDQLNCTIRFLDEAAQSRALELGKDEYARRLPLFGIPVGLKDLIDLAGVPTTAGSILYRDQVPEKNAFLVDRLQAAGAVITAKQNMHEIALGVTTANPHFGICRNPWDLNRIPGGSSGGSAAALAAGLCLGAVGTDTGGSIRIPAALCGVVGLKPTRGRVSLTGVFPLSWNLDHAGPLAVCVRDAASLLQVIAGYDPDDPVCPNLPVPDYLENLDAGISGWRIARAAGDYCDDLSADVSLAMRSVEAVFRDLGASVRPVDMDWLEQAAGANALMTQADASVIHRARLAKQPQDFGADVRQRLINGSSVGMPEYALARRTQAEACRHMELFFEDWQLLILPAVPVPAPVLGAQDPVAVARLLTRYTAPFNLTGLPAISIPGGFSRDGLPIGLQIVGPAWQEVGVLQAAASYENAAGWKRRAEAFSAAGR